MVEIINTEKIPVFSWATGLEEGALEQAKNMANLPFAVHHISLMPDAHQGYGMPIGGVLATKDVIIPNAVGVDIGCGMVACKTSLTDILPENLGKIHHEITRSIPTGFNHHKKPQEDWLLPSFKDMLEKMNNSIILREHKASLNQIGTLGGGNHFIEIQKGDDGYIWIMIHSGSRNLGYKVAKYYNDQAKVLNARYYSSIPKEWELAFLPIGTKEAKNYINEMQICVDFALTNRKRMLTTIQKIFTDFFKGIDEVEFASPINIAHNYARFENHFKQDVIVHRKGATSAKAGEVGIIPGSQGTKSYIVRGLGEKISFTSCSHGAGRNMGRKQAQKNLNLDEEKAKMGTILHNMKSDKDLDEAPGAYKDINQVMNNQKDLTERLVELTPLAVIKG